VRLRARNGTIRKCGLTTGSFVLNGRGVTFAVAIYQPPNRLTGGGKGGVVERPPWWKGEKGFGSSAVKELTQRVHRGYNMGNRVTA